jgi:hypothetical protein
LLPKHGGSRPRVRGTPSEYGFDSMSGLGRRPGDPAWANSRSHGGRCRSVICSFGGRLANCSHLLLDHPQPDDEHCMDLDRAQVDQQGLYQVFHDP